NSDGTAAVPGDRALTVGAGGITANGYVALRAADNVTINGTVDSSGAGGTVLIVAGNAAGMNLPAAELPGVPAGVRAPAIEATLDFDTDITGLVPPTKGGVTFNAPVLAGAGNIVINSTGPVTQPTTGATGLINTGDLVVRTYNSTPNPAPSPTSTLITRPPPGFC
ncbi:MAG: hypothetical protein HYV99_06805, partial [Betaproteobacteria bacterium]|nr:hypothetical protein [Betaproteobacteria bacterium]